jgi:adenine C2-methylase RlmN of 23S rRNA A2503 and tRNA A37
MRIEEIEALEKLKKEGADSLPSPERRKFLQIGLAVSLHAPNDALRTQLVPVNKG